MSTLEFNVEANIFPSRPTENSMVEVYVSGLRATDGTLFNGAVEFFYFTPMTPFYSNTTAVRMIAGQFLVDVEDDVLAQFIWYFSKEAKLKNYRDCYARIKPEHYASYRMRWVTAAVIVTLLSGSGVNARMQKRLGDLSVLRDNAAKDLLNNMLRELEELSDILEDGGDWGRHPETATRGEYHPDTPVVGRMWASEQKYRISPVPGANRLTIPKRQSRVKKTYKGRF